MSDMTASEMSQILKNARNGNDSSKPPMYYDTRLKKFVKNGDLVIPFDKIDGMKW